MKYVYSLLLLCCSILLCSCEYSPSGSHYSEVSPTPRLNLSINLNETGDTLYARSRTTYTYNTYPVNKPVYATELWLGNKLLHHNSANTSSVTIDTREFSNGIHELKLVVLTNSGTGSLSDRKGGEQIEVYRKWIMKIDNAPPSPVQVTKVEAEDGTLKIEWEKYTRPYISNYKLYRYNKNGNTVKVLTFKPDVTSWTDKDYVGGEAYYSVVVTDLDERMAASERVLFNAPAPKLLEYRYQNENELVLTFSSTRLYRNFGVYRLAHEYSSPFNYLTNVITDTVITFKNIPFGKSLDFILTTIPKDTDNEYPYSTYESFTVNGYGSENSYTPFNFTAFNPAANLFYDFSKPEFKTIDATTLKIKNQQTYNYSSYGLSANGKYLYVYVSGEGILQIDPLTLNVLKTHRLNELVSGVTFSSLSLSVSNTNRLLLNFSGFGEKDSFFLVDMNTRNVEFQKKQSYSNNASVSPDGQMVATSSYIFRKQSSGDWSEEFKLNFNYYNLLRYHPTEPLYRMEGVMPTTFYSTTTGDAVKTYSFAQDIHFSYIDVATGYVIANDEDYLYIYDKNGSALLKKFLRSGFVKFYKDRLYASNYYLPLTF